MTDLSTNLLSKNSSDLHQSREATSGKSGVDMSTPVQPVATPLAADDGRHYDDNDAISIHITHLVSLSVSGSQLI